MVDSQQDYLVKELIFFGSLYLGRCESSPIHWCKTKQTNFGPPMWASVCLEWDPDWNGTLGFGLNGSKTLNTFTPSFGLVHFYTTQDRKHHSVPTGAAVAQRLSSCLASQFVEVYLDKNLSPNCSWW